MLVSGRPEDVCREVGTRTERTHVVEFFELAFDLVEARGVGDKEEHAAFRAVADGRAEDRVEVEGAAGEESGDVGHDAGMIADVEFEDHGRSGSDFWVCAARGSFFRRVDVRSYGG